MCTAFYFLSPEIYDACLPLLLVTYVSEVKFTDVTETANRSALPCRILTGSRKV